MQAERKMPSTLTPDVDNATVGRIRMIREMVLYTISLLLKERSC